jgi:HEPN domain-containing protein
MSTTYHPAVIESGDIWMEKAGESLAGAASEFINGRYNSCANRCHYAAFQAVVQALSDAGIRPPGSDEYWGHDFVQAQFTGQLINR